MSKMTKMIAALGVVAGLGVAALPLSSYAADPKTSKNVPLELTIEPEIAISTSVDSGEGSTDTDAAKVSLAKVGTVGEDKAEYKSDGFYVTVKTNNIHGYTIGIKTAGDETALVAGNGTDKIAAGALATGESKWAFMTGTLVNATGVEANGTSEATSWKAVTASNVDFYTATRTEGGIDNVNGVNTPVIFGATIAPDQAAGTYSNRVVFTATASPAPTEQE